MSANPTDTRPPLPTGLLEDLGRLTSDQLRERIAELEAEERGLRVLLRSVSARERAARRQGAKHVP